MKKILCKRCSQSWFLEDAQLDKLQVCPFCAKPVREKADISRADTLDKAIYLTITSMGERILSQPHRIGGYICDIAPGLQKDVKILSRSFSEEYFSLVRTAYGKELPEAERLMKTLSRRLMDDEGLSESWSARISESYLGAIRLSRGIGMEEHLMLRIEDFRVPAQTVQTPPPQAQPKTPVPQPPKTPAPQLPKKAAAPPAPPKTKSSDFVIFQVNGESSLVRYNGSDKNIVIPGTVTEIDTGAFKHNATIESVTIPGCVKTVKLNAFADCSRLRKVEVKLGTQKIDYSAFANCPVLESVSLSATAWQVAMDAFRGCNNLKTMTVGSVHHIHIVSKIPSLRDVYVPASLKPHFVSCAKQQKLTLHTI